LVVSSMERLSGLLKKAEPILQAALPQQQPDLFHPSQPLPNEEVSAKRTTPD